MDFLKVGHKYRHKDSKDIDLQVTRYLGENADSGHHTYIVKYWNRHSRIFQGYQQAVRIKASDLHKWTEVKDVE